jgi:hypothetical protein
MDHFWLSDEQFAKIAPHLPTDTRAACRKNFSITSGTLFASHKLPLRGYLAAIAIFCNEVKGKSMLALSRDLGTSYKAAFVLARRDRALDRDPHHRHAPTDRTHGRCAAGRFNRSLRAAAITLRHRLSGFARGVSDRLRGRSRAGARDTAKTSRDAGRSALSG